MSEDRIENIKSFRKLKEEVSQLEQFLKHGWLLRLLGINKQKRIDYKQKLTEIREQLTEISTMPDKFNEYFSDRGWIAYESMNHEFIKVCVGMGEAGKYDDVELELLEYYKPDNIIWNIKWAKSVKEIGVRSEIINYAFDDYKAGRYYSCIPLLLLIIDGSVNDIDKQNGFFSEKVDMMAWDSIAAHSSGLSKIKELFSKSRNSTSNEEITLPYRNGIMHGRELKYYSLPVAAKCWGALFAISDWAKSVREGKRGEEPLEEKLSFSESFNNLRKTVSEHRVNMKEIARQRVAIDNWKAREVLPKIDFPEFGTSNDYEENTPERELILFFENWVKENYGKLSLQIRRSMSNVENANFIASKYRKIFAFKKLAGFRMLSIVDEAPAVSEIEVELNIDYNNDQLIKIKKFRLLYEDETQKPLTRGDVNGKWRILENFNDIEYIL